MNKMPRDNLNPANPKLWYRDDLVNHPELVPLEGGTIPYADAKLLTKIYSGATLLTDKITKIRDTVFLNGDLTLRVDTFDGLYAPYYLFEDPISTENIAKVAEQWLTGDTDIDNIHTVTITLNEPKVISEYWMIAAVGTSEYIDKLHPTPKSWKLLGSNDNKHFSIIDEQQLTDPTCWQSWHICPFRVSDESNTAYTQIILLITEWFPSDEPLSTGLKRLWLFGRPKDLFVLPDIPCPNESFVWVVPYKEKL